MGKFSRYTEQGGAVNEVRDRPVFWALVALLAWAPVPLGSNRTLAAALLVCWAVFLLLGSVWAWRRHPVAAVDRLWRFRWPLFVLGLYVALVWLQLLPLPLDVLTLLSPEAAAVQGPTAEGWAVPSPGLSLDPSQTAFYAALSVAYLCAFVVVLMTVRNSERMDQMAFSLVVIGVVQASLSVLLYSLGARYQLFFFDVIHDRAKGTMSYHNHFAGYMEMCVAMGVGLMLARLGHEAGVRRRGWRQHLRHILEFLLSPKMRLRLMLVVMVIALVLTRSRMGNAGFFAGLLGVGLITLALTRRSAPAMVALVLSLVVVDVVVVGTWVGLERVVQRLQETSLTVDGGGREESVELRQEAARYAVDLVRDFPAWGAGAGSFYANYPRYRSMARAYFDHAHNDYVELAADVGLVGLGLLGSLVLMTAGVAMSALAHRRSSMPRGVAFGVLLALAAIAIHSTVDFNLQLPANALTMVVVLACGWAAWALPRGLRPERSG